MSSAAPKPNPSASAIRVTLAGSHGDQMSATLDDAVAHLQAATQAEIPACDLGEFASLLSLIEVVSAANSRREALQALVSALAELSPEATVHAGIGRTRMTLFVDSKLGWLGPESSLYQQANSRWERPKSKPSDRYTQRASLDGLNNTHHSSDDEALGSDEPGQVDLLGCDIPCMLRREGVLELHLPRRGDTSRCVVWIDENASAAYSGLPEIVTTLSTLLWSRPSRSLPKFALRFARRTTILVAVAAVLLSVMAVWPVHYRIACTAKVETTGGRLIATPFEATLLSALVRPGDRVRQGDALLVLDGRPLRLERESLEAEIGQVSKEHDVALATRRIADAQQAALRRQQLTRQLDLINDRLGRLEVVSPIDGVIVSGDLDKYIGSPLERGQTLIEVAPLHKMVIEVEIPEHEIGYVSKGTDTRVKIDAVGGPSLRAPLSELYPAAELRDDRNVFIGRIDLDNPDGKLRPGMRGEATAYGPLRPWIWSWLRSGVERALWWVGY